MVETNDTFVIYALMDRLMEEAHEHNTEYFICFPLISIYLIYERIIFFRPPLEALENSFDFVRDSLKECWAENPDDRPDFKSIRAKLRPLRKGM